MTRRFWTVLCSGVLALVPVLFSICFVSAHGSNLSSRHLYKVANVQPQDSSDLYYNGGSVMDGTSQVYAIFWEPRGSKVSTNYNKLILQYFSDVGSSPLYHNNTQYTDSQGAYPSNAVLGGSWVDTKTAYPSTTLLDSDIQQEVLRAISTKGWTPSTHHLFVVFTALNVANNAETAYHGSFTDYSGNGVIYATVPDTFTKRHVFPGNVSPNNDFDADSTILVTSHEQIEAATDPFPGSGWMDNNGLEIGDKCEKYFGQQNADGSNVIWNGHPYIVQGEWDNALHACTLVGP